MNELGPSCASDFIDCLTQAVATEFRSTDRGRLRWCYAELGRSDGLSPREDTQTQDSQAGHQVPGYTSALTQDGGEAACPFLSHDRPTPKGASPRVRAAPRLRGAEGRGAAASAAVGTR